MEVISAEAFNTFLEQSLTTQIVVMLIIVAVVILLVVMLLNRVAKQQGEQLQSQRQQTDKQLAVIERQQEQHKDQVTEYRRTNDALLNLTDTLRSQQRTLGDIVDDVDALPGKIRSTVGEHDTAMDSRVAALSTLIGQGFSEQKMTLTSILDELQGLKPQIAQHNRDGASLANRVEALIGRFEKLITDEHPAVEMPPAFGD